MTTPYLTKRVCAGTFTQWCNLLLDGSNETVNDPQDEVKLPIECIEALSLDDLTCKSPLIGKFNVCAH